MSYFSRNLNHHSKCRVRKEIFQTILTTIFWNFSIFYHRPDQPQVKRKVVATTTSLVYGFSHELPNNLRLRILGNKEILGKSLIWFEKGQVSLPEIKLWNSNQKSRHNQISKFSSPVKFYWISLFCFNYFVQDILSKKILALNWTESPANLNFLTFCISSKHFSNL